MKLPYLKKRLAEKSENIPLIALTETWLKSYITDAIVDMMILEATAVQGVVGVFWYTAINGFLYDDRTCQALLCTCEL